VAEKNRGMGRGLAAILSVSDKKPDEQEELRSLALDLISPSPNQPRKAFDDAGLQEGQRVLINGAGGAVGGYAVQLAKRAGAHVIATASARSAERARSAGADHMDLGTSETDVAARALYESLGFAVTSAPYDDYGLRHVDMILPAGAARHSGTAEGRARKP